MTKLTEYFPNRGLIGTREFHGAAKANTRLYRIWKDIRGRCYRPTHSHYNYYGAKGVKVCLPWHKFPTFQDWALANSYTDDLFLARRDTAKSYEPENCLWTTRSEIAKNRDRNQRRKTND